MNNFTLLALHRFFCWINSFIQIFCCIINIVTFTIYRPYLEISFLSWSSRLVLTLKQKQDNRRKKK